MRRAPNEPLPGAPDPWAPSEMPAFRGRPPYVMSEMIAAEPALAERLLRRLSTSDAMTKLTSLIRDAVAAGEPVITTGCGTSEHAAMAIAAMLNDALGLKPGSDVRSIQALEALRRPPAAGVFIGVSHEGGTHATNEALRAARDAGATTALITVGGGSPGASVADVVVTTDEQDQSWCHTVGYLSPLIVGAGISARLGGKRPDAAAIRSLLDVTQEARAPAAIAAGLSGTDRLIVVGSGPDYVSAREMALKVAEGARLAAGAHELETILHGHLAAASRWTGLVLVLTDDTSEIADRARKVLDAAKALAIPAAALLSDATDKMVPAEATPAGRIVIRTVGRVPAVVGSLLASAVALQLLTEHLARARSVDPDTLGREDPAQASAHA